MNSRASNLFNTTQPDAFVQTWGEVPDGMRSSMMAAMTKQADINALAAWCWGMDHYNQNVRPFPCLYLDAFSFCFRFLLL
jgi:hypothetical protein